MIDPSWPNPNIGKKIALDIARLRVATQLMGAKEQIVGDLGPPTLAKRELGPDGSVVINGKTIREKITSIGGLLIYKERLITLHIYEQGQTFETINRDPKEGRRVHFANCETLIGMRHSGRIDKYIAGDRIDGTFKCHLFKNSSAKERKDCFVKLAPCKLCLNELDYKNFSELFFERNTFEKSRSNLEKIVKEFNYEEFFGENKPMLRYHPHYTGKTYPKGGYPFNWSEISRRTREMHEWKCQECGVFCGETKNRNLLHTHHKDGIKKNVKLSNLQVLCIFCHYHKPYHSCMKIDQPDLNRLRRLQKEQGIETTG